MAIDVRVLGRSRVLQGGVTTAGVAKNDKELVWGDMDITVYTAAGEPVVAQDFGMTTIDAIFISVLDVDGSAPTTTSVHLANYDYTAELLLLWDSDNPVAVAGTSGQVKFLVFGDSASAPELT